ncbi:MAG: DUF1836 domain-containing protein [Lachnospiraceae bacterium]|nr:DUF1836 domain-containing protein [Lachnospiraceae bacterium]
MTMKTEELLNSILESFDRIDYIKSEDIPNIDLYMDQVTTFMDNRMRHKTRNPEEDKVLTKTMINNYAKNDLLPPPVKKKYSKEHMLVLIFIYYFKNILSIGDIQSILNPLTDRFFGKTDDFNLTKVYDEVFRWEDEQVEVLKKDVTERYLAAQNSFSDAPEDAQEFLQYFSFICLLSFDVYVKKQLIEKLIDDLAKKTEEQKSEPKKEKAKAKQSKEEQ